MGCLRTNYRTYEQVINLTQKYCNNTGKTCAVYQDASDCWHFVEKGSYEFRQLRPGQIKKLIYPMPSN